MKSKGLENEAVFSQYPPPGHAVSPGKVGVPQKAETISPKQAAYQKRDDLITEGARSFVFFFFWFLMVTLLSSER